MKPGADSSELDLALERAWRAHSREAPPPELDRAILAAAHRAAGSGPQDALKAAAEATRPQRWWMPLAAAATIGVIAIGILQLTPQEHNVVAPDERAAAVERRGAEEPLPAPAVDQGVDDAVKERDAAPTGARSDASSDFRQEKKQEAKPAASVPVPAPAAPPAAPIERENKVATAKPAARAPEPQRLAQAKDKAAASALSGRPAPAAEGAVSSFASAPPPAGSPPAPARPDGDGGLARNEAIGQAAPAAPPSPMRAEKAASLEDLRAQARDPDAWIVRIRKLRDEGDTAEGLRELREFRNLVPDADRRLPADLLAWANTFKP